MSYNMMNMKYLLTFNTKHLLIFFTFLLLFFSFALSYTVMAEKSFAASTCSIKNIGGCDERGKLVNVIYKNLFVFGGILGVFMIMFRGVAITIATAQGAVIKRDEAIREFENVVIGLGLLALSYIILNTINPDILSFN